MEMSGSRQAWNLKNTSTDIEVAQVWYVEGWTTEVALRMMGREYMLFTETKRVAHVLDLGMRPREEW